MREKDGAIATIRSAYEAGSRLADNGFTGGHVGRAASDWPAKDTEPIRRSLRKWRRFLPPPSPCHVSALVLRSSVSSRSHAHQSRDCYPKSSHGNSNSVGNFQIQAV